MAREDRGDRRFARDEEDRKRPEEGLKASNSRRRERVEPEDERDRHLQRRPGGHDDEPIRVPKKREEAHVERIPVEEGQTPEEIEVRDDEVLIPVTEEEIVMERREVVKEVLRVRKEVVEDEEVVGDVDEARETGGHRGLDEHARGGSSARERHEALGHEEGGSRVPRRRGDRDRDDDRSFIDKAKEALSGDDTRRREEGRTSREDEPPRRRRR